MPLLPPGYAAFWLGVLALYCGFWTAVLLSRRRVALTLLAAGFALIALAARLSWRNF